MAEWQAGFSQIDRSVDQWAGEIREMRRYLHAHPEPSGEEFRTSAYLVDRISELPGVEYRLGPEGRGLIVDFPRPRARRRLAFRADIDALRLQDEKTVTYRSRESDLMHACGHDAHTAMAWGTLKTLAENSGLFPEDLAFRCLFQPAEETATGAREFIEANALENVEAIIALHVDPTLHAGQIGWRHGPLTACAEEFDILLEGVGGHGARPHTTRDPIAAAAQLVQAAYAQIPRGGDARVPLVLSFGVIQGGINPNVIPESVQLRGTIRYPDAAEARRARQQLREISDAIAQACQVHAHFSIAYSVPPVTNDPRLTDRCTASMESLLGPGGLVRIELPSMGGEDFAWYLRHCPGCLLRLGVGTPLQPVHHLHSPKFDINEAALPFGAKALARSLYALAWSEPPST